MGHQRKHGKPTHPTWHRRSGTNILTRRRGESPVQQGASHRRLEKEDFDGEHLSLQACLGPFRETFGAALRPLTISTMYLSMSLGL